MQIFKFWLVLTTTEGGGIKFAFKLKRYNEINIRIMCVCVCLKGKINVILSVSHF